VEQERAELVAEPEATLGVPAYRLDVEVGPGQEPIVGLLVRDLERDLSIRVAQLYKLPDRDLPASPVGGLEVRVDSVGAQLEVRGVAFLAEAVIGHRLKLSVSGFQHRRDATNGLAFEGRRSAALGLVFEFGAGRGVPSEGVRG
jgi:hypothetical protein